MQNTWLALDSLAWDAKATSVLQNWRVQHYGKKKKLQQVKLSTEWNIVKPKQFHNKYTKQQQWNDSSFSIYSKPSKQYSAVVCNTERKNGLCAMRNPVIGMRCFQHADINNAVAYCTRGTTRNKISQQKSRHWFIK